MENLKLFHDYSITITIGILVFISFAIFYLRTNQLIHLRLTKGSFIEIIWTVVPAVILIIIAIPRLLLLYWIDEIYDPFLTVKVIAHQWYWTYEYRDFIDLEFDSYIIPENDLKIGDKRNLEVDNRLVLPINETIRLLITSADVIHSWAVPRLGVKIDAVPGRLNQIQLFRNRVGVFYGQCSEICGANHSFIPIAVEIITLKDFLEWL